MNTPINIDELKAIKIYPSKERALDGTRLSDLTALVWKMEDDAMSRPLNSPMPEGFFCAISPAALDKWAEQAHKRVMESVDKLIYRKKCDSMRAELFDRNNHEESWIESCRRERELSDTKDLIHLWINSRLNDFKDRRNCYNPRS